MENVDLCQFLFLFSSVCASLIKVPCFSTYLVQFMLHNDGIVYHKHTMNNMASNCHRKSRFLYRRVVVCCLLALFINPVRFAPTTHPKLHFAFGRVNFLRTIYLGSVFFHANWAQKIKLWIRFKWIDMKNDVEHNERQIGVGNNNKGQQQVALALATRTWWKNCSNWIAAN